MLSLFIVLYLEASFVLFYYYTSSTGNMTQLLKPCGTESTAVLEIIYDYFGGRDLEEEDLHIYVYIV